MSFLTIKAKLKFSYENIIIDCYVTVKDSRLETARTEPVMM